MIRHPVHHDIEAEVDNYIFLSNRERRAKHRGSKPRNHSTNQISIERFSYHAQMRAAQRGLSAKDIVYILRYGQRYYAANAVFYLLLGKNIREDDHRKMSHLTGTVIIVDKAHTTIITIWRNRQHALRNIRRKLAAVWYNS